MDSLDHKPSDNNESQQMALDIRDEAIDVDEIMERIRTSIEQKKQSQIYVEEPWMLQEIEQPHLRLVSKRTTDNLAMLQIAGKLDLEGEPISSHRPMFGGIIKFLKRTSRFWIRRYTDAIFFKQNHFNLEVVQVLNQMNLQIQELRDENERLRKKLDTLQQNRQ